MEVTLKYTGEGGIYPVCGGQWKLWLEYIYMYLNVCTVGWNWNTVKTNALVTKMVKYGDIWSQGKGSVEDNSSLRMYTWQAVLLRPVFIYRWQNKWLRSMGEGLQ